MIRTALPFRTFLICLTLSVTPRAIAQHDMRFFVGHWDFSIWSTEDVSGAPAFTGEWFVEDGLDSALALVDRVQLNDGPGVQGGTFTRELIAFDSHAGRYTRTIITNTGASYSFTSSGWNGDELTWIGEQRSAAGIVKLREVIVRTGPGSFTAVFHRKEGDVWVLQSNERLTRR